MFGGKSTSGSLKDVQYASINNDGTLGAWKRGANFPGARTNFISGYANGYLYLYGGCTTGACTSGRNDIVYAQVNADGSIDPWQLQAATNSPYLSSGAIYKGYLYQVGGAGISSGNASNNYAPLTASGRIARYSKLIDLGSQANINSINVNGLVPASSVSPGASQITFRSSLEGNAWRAGYVPTSSITPGVTTCDSSSATYARYVLVAVTLDDTYGTGFADASGTPANISDITLDYTPAHPLPNQRLARGKSLIEGQLKPLDTCG